MIGKWMKAWGLDYRRGCIYQLIGAAVVIPLFAVCIVVPLYFANRPGVTEAQFLQIIIIPAVLFLVVFLGGSFGFLFWSLRKRSAWLDEIFAPLGLVGRRYAFTGRQYHGQVRGREADVLFMRGPSLSIYLSTNLYTRAAISDPSDVSSNLARMFNKIPIETVVEDLVFYARDEGWGKEFADGLEVQNLLRDLIHDESPFYIRQVLIEPGYILLRLYRSDKVFDFTIPPEQGRRWVNQLFRLAELAEQQAAPQEDLPASSFTQALRQGSASSWGLIIAAVMAVLAICVGVGAFLLVLVMEGGG